MAHTHRTAYTTTSTVREGGKQFTYEMGWCLCGTMTYRRLA